MTSTSTTDRLPVEEVAAEVIRQLGSWPPASTVTDPAPLAHDLIAAPSAILITGPRAVGTSMVAWQVLTASVASGHRTSYLDLDQLGFLPEAPQEVVVATTLTNVATCWSGFKNQGTERLVLCGHADGDDLRAVRDLLPSLRVIALTARTDTLLERARRRSRQKDVWLPGDDLFGRDEAHLREVVRDAASFEPDHADLVIETDGLAPAHIAETIAPLWPGATAS